MLTIKFADNSEYAIHEDTTVYPSGNSTVRSRMEIHMAGDAMSLADFEALVTDAEKTETIRIIRTELEKRTNEATGEESQIEVVVSDIAYTAYTEVARRGKDRVDVTDHATGVTTSETHLVAVLEQLTYMEQQLRKLGLM